MWEYKRRNQQQWPENVIPSVKPHDRGTIPRHDRPVNDDTGSPAIPLPRHVRPVNDDTHSPAKSPRGSDAGSSSSSTEAADIDFPRTRDDDQLEADTALAVMASIASYADLDAANSPTEGADIATPPRDDDDLVADTSQAMIASYADSIAHPPPWCHLPMGQLLQI